MCVCVCETCSIYSFPFFSSHSVRMGPAQLPVTCSTTGKSLVSTQTLLPFPLGYEDRKSLVNFITVANQQIGKLFFLHIVQQTQLYNIPCMYDSHPLRPASQLTVVSYLAPSLFFLFRAPRVPMHNDSYSISFISTLSRGLPTKSNRHNV